jgi:hypothetical protein
LMLIQINDCSVALFASKQLITTFMSAVSLSLV